MFDAAPGRRLLTAEPVEHDVAVFGQRCPAVSGLITIGMVAPCAGIDHVCAGRGYRTKACSSTVR
jgi:hypothetical protein